MSVIPLLAGLVFAAPSLVEYWRHPAWGSLGFITLGLSAMTLWVFANTDLGLWGYALLAAPAVVALVLLRVRPISQGE